MLLDQILVDIKIGCLDGGRVVKSVVVLMINRLGYRKLRSGFHIRWSIWQRLLILCQ